jgi:hypothetical protein
MMFDDAETLADALDEQEWDASFAKSQNKLVAAAKKAREEIARGLATPLDLDQLDAATTADDCSGSYRED